MNMEDKIQLIHPEGRKAVRINKEKYDILRREILDTLIAGGESTYADMLLYTTADFNKKKIVFEGSLEWYLEWVKLDLEARKEIKRVSDKSPVKYTIR
jgi:hypothetical protein